jgi:RNA polymerase sigma factor (sigma-70 family)
MSRARIDGAVAGPLGSLYRLGATGDLTDGQLLEWFLTRDDPAASEAAFAELVNRHGAMVLDACRREVRNPEDAHDAFQATFLILVSKASTIRRRDSVAGWLFIIARRVAAQARGEGVRRRRLLEELGRDRCLSADGPDGEPELDDTPLFDEVGRLPERYRVPVVLHYFEGLSTEATAQRLGCARGTVLSRLSRARHRLKERIERRGLSPAILIPAPGVRPRWWTPVPVPASLAASTTRAACSLGLAGAALESVVPAKVAGLSRRAGRTLALSRASAASLLAVAALGVSIGVAATLQPGQSPAMTRPAPGLDEASPRRPDASATPQEVTVRGRVLDPDGRPAAGARLFETFHAPDGESDIRSVGLAGPDGRFEVRLRPVPNPGHWFTPQVASRFLGVIAATAPGCGPDWTPIFAARAAEPITLRLRRDDVPIEGRVVSLEGRPIPGVEVGLETLTNFPPSFLDEIRGNGGQVDLNRWIEVAYGLPPGNSNLIPAVRTDADGRFRMTGLGRDRAGVLRLRGASIERTFVLVVAAADRGFRPIPLGERFWGNTRIEGPRFTVTAAPGRAFEGVVRDRDTDRPIAAALVNDWWGHRIATDADGRFRMDGLPRTGPPRLSARVEAAPFVECFTDVNRADGMQTVHIEMALKRGVWVTGRVVDRATGRPVQAVLSYYPTTDNPHVKDYPGALFLENSVPHLPVIATDDDGRFRAAVPPGKGLLTVRATAPGYLGVGRDQMRAAGDRIINPLGFGSDLSTYNAFVPVDLPTEGGKPLPDIALARGREQHLRPVDAEGHPVSGTMVYCMQGGSSTGEPLEAPELRFVHASPGTPVRVAIVHEARALGAMIDVKGDEPDPITITLRPTGTVTGRLLHEDGKPRPGVRLEVRQRLLHRGMDIHTDHGGPLTTGPDGRFAIKHLIPGMPYDVTVAQKPRMNAPYESEGYLISPQWSVEPGENREWGDVRVQAHRR